MYVIEILKGILVCCLAFLVAGCLNHRGNTDRPKIALSEDSLLKKDSADVRQLIADYDLGRTDTFSAGDLDRDGKRDTAFIQPLTFYYHHGNIDSQYVYITFSCNLPPIKHYNGFQGMLANAGDLDGNDTSEIIYFPDWYQSNDALMYIYGFKHGQWEVFATAETRRDIIGEKKDPLAFLKSRIKKVNNNSFKLTEHRWKDCDIVDSVKTVIIP